ncbi:MAG: tautomerase family protein [Agarilytica sp.]
MILVFGIREKLDPVKAQMSDIIHFCMSETLGMPEDKRAHRFFPLERDNFFYPGGRTDAYTVIEINMMQGRSKNTHKDLIKLLFKELEAKLGITPVDIEITINEQAPHMWGFRGATGDEAALDYPLDPKT